MWKVDDINARVVYWRTQWQLTRQYTGFKSSTVVSNADFAYKVTVWEAYQARTILLNRQLGATWRTKDSRYMKKKSLT